MNWLTRQQAVIHDVEMDRQSIIQFDSSPDGNAADPSVFKTLSITQSPPIREVYD